MDEDAKFVVRLIDPIIVGTVFFGIEREEVIDVLILRPMPHTRPFDEDKRLTEVAKLIDWGNSDYMLDTDYQLCDVGGAIRQANVDAVKRAENYCRYRRYQEDRTFEPFTHGTIRDHIKLVFSNDARA